MRERARSIVSILLVVGVAACAGRPVESRPEGFADLVRALSEPGGYFDTDNLISNERSYLHVLPELEETGVSGGAYIGVGPDQNFSYIAAIRPRLAFLIDIRRDNLLQHLLFKALFALSRNRVDYLCHLFGRPPPPELDSWDESSVGAIVELLDGTSIDLEFLARAHRSVDEEIGRYGLELTAQDWDTIERFHRAFAEAGLSLRFTSFGRRPQLFYPTYRDLLLERDLAGRRASYLARETDFRFLKQMQAADRLVPVVGDLAGDHALAAIGAELAEREIPVSAFYASNVEFYLFRAGTFGRFARNLTALPMTESSVIIRSVFHSFYGPHPKSVPGYYSTQLTQGLAELRDGWAAGAYQSYWGLVTGERLPSARSGSGG